MIVRPVRLVGWLALVIVLLAAMAVKAEAADPGCGGRVAKAQFELGQAHNKLGNYQQAMADFEAGYACVPLPLFLYDIAQMARLSGQRAKALEFYRRYLAAEPNARERVYVQRSIGVLSKAHATDAPPPPSPRAPPLIAPTAPPPTAVVAPPPAVVPPSPPVVAPLLVVTPPPPAPEKPSHKGRWIALGVIGGVLVIGGAVTAGVLLGTKSSSGVPGNFHNLGSF